MSGESCPYPALVPPVNVKLFTAPQSPCPYLPDRQATLRYLHVSRMPAATYHAFMDAGFRRAGLLVYQPVCRGCRLCMPIRVPVARFQPGKSLRRCARRNADLIARIDQPVLTEEKFELY